MAQKTKVQETDKRQQKLEDETPETPPPGKAGDDEKLKENRERLNVDERHRTPDMEKKHRGTFP